MSPRSGVSEAELGGTVGTVTSGGGATSVVVVGGGGGVVVVVFTTMAATVGTSDTASVDRLVVGADVGGAAVSDPPQPVSASTTSRTPLAAAGIHSAFRESTGCTVRAVRRSMKPYVR